MNRSVKYALIAAGLGYAWGQLPARARRDILLAALTRPSNEAREPYRPPGERAAEDS